MKTTIALVHISKCRDPQWGDVDNDNDDGSDCDNKDEDKGITSLSRETCLLFAPGEALARFPRGAPRLRSRLLLSRPIILPATKTFKTASAVAKLYLFHHLQLLSKPSTF